MNQLYDIMVTNIPPSAHGLPGIGMIEYVYSRPDKSLAINISGNEAVSFCGKQAQIINNEVAGISGKKVNQTRIIEAVEYGTQVSIDALKSPLKLRELVELRQLAMWWMRANTKLTTAKIGAIFNRDHATVIHATKTVNALLSNNPTFRVLADDFVERMQNFNQ